MARTLLPLAFLAVFLTGCGAATGTLRGTVTLNGEPLERGDMSLSSEDGKGGTAGSPIEAGRFEVKGLKPGKYAVSISGVYTGPVIMPGDTRKFTQADIKAMMDPLPSDTTGKQVTIEIQAGSQSRDFPLESKSKAAGRK